MPDILGLANLALRRLNEGEIASLQDPRTAARACSLFLSLALDEVTSEHEWSWAVHRAPAEPVEGENHTLYDRAYRVPADALRVIGLSPEAQFELESNAIYTDAVDPVVVYIRSLVQESPEGDLELIPGRYPPKFFNACSLRLAMMVAVPLGGDKRLMQMLAQEYAHTLAGAKNAAAMESPGLDEEAKLWENIQ